MSTTSFKVSKSPFLVFVPGMEAHYICASSKVPNSPLFFLTTGMEACLTGLALFPCNLCTMSGHCLPWTQLHCVQETDQHMCVVTWLCDWSVFCCLSRAISCLFLGAEMRSVCLLPAAPPATPFGVGGCVWGDVLAHTVHRRQASRFTCDIMHYDVESESSHLGRMHLGNMGILRGRCTPSALEHLPVCTRPAWRWWQTACMCEGRLYLTSPTQSWCHILKTTDVITTPYLPLLGTLGCYFKVTILITLIIGSFPVLTIFGE